MEKENDWSKEEAELRSHAEEQLGVKTAELHSTRAEEETQRLVHELEVHRVELEMQNAELLRTRDALETALVWYTDLYDYAPVGYFSIDSDGTIHSVNLLGAAKLGIDRSRLIGRRIGTFVSPGTRELFDVFLRNIFGNHIKDSCEVNLVREGQEPLYARIEAAPCQSGHECRLVVIDITERKRMDEALQQAKEDWERTLNAVPDLIAILDTDYRIVRVNRAMANQLGLTPEGCIGQRCYATVHGTSGPPAFCPHSQLLDDGHEHAADVCEALLGGNYSVTVSPLFDPEGKLFGSVHVARNITERKRMEEALLEANNRLEERVIERTAELTEANRRLEQSMASKILLESQLLDAKKLEAIGQLAAGVAHEVRNPLNAILSITEALFREDEIADNPEYEPYIQHIRTQVGRLTQLMKDLLELGKPIPASSLHPVPLLQLCRDTVALLESSGLQGNNRYLIVSDRASADPWVLTDSVKLQQVLFNVVENAVQHSPEGREIVLRLVDAGSAGTTVRMAVVWITDAGKGIPADRVSRVFDPFYTDRKGGTGLGLALVKHFMEHMGGSVKLWNNDPPPGCTVEVRIPLAERERE